MEVIAYADKANERLRRRYRTLVLGKIRNKMLLKQLLHGNYLVLFGDDDRKNSLKLALVFMYTFDN